MKLTVAQQKIMDMAKQKIDLARNTNAMEFANKQHGICNNIKTFEFLNLQKEYDEAVKGIVHVYGKDETFRKLEALGLIKIINVKLNKFIVLDY